MDLETNPIKEVDGKESVKCVFPYTPKFVRDITEKTMEVLIENNKTFIVELAKSKDIDSSCVG